MLPVRNRYDLLTDECVIIENEDDCDLTSVSNESTSDDADSKSDNHNAEATEVSRPLAEDQPWVDVACLKPVPLITLLLQCGENEIKAMLDSGSSRNLMQEHVVKLFNVAVYYDDHISIGGLGKSVTRSIGTVNIEIDILGEKENLSVVVVPDKSINYDLILGIDFLKSRKMSINVSRRKITRNRNDGSVLHFYLNNVNGIETVIYENVPVYASKDVRISKNGNNVPIDFSLCAKLDLSPSEFYYEGLV